MVLLARVCGPCSPFQGHDPSNNPVNKPAVAHTHQGPHRSAQGHDSHQRPHWSALRPKTHRRPHWSAISKRNPASIRRLCHPSYTPALKVFFRSRPIQDLGPSFSEPHFIPSGHPWFLRYVLRKFTPQRYKFFFGPDPLVIFVAHFQSPTSSLAVTLGSCVTCCENFLWHISFCPETWPIPVTFPHQFACI